MGAEKKLTDQLFAPLSARISSVNILSINLGYCHGYQQRRFYSSAIWRFDDSVHPLYGNKHYCFFQRKPVDNVSDACSLLYQLCFRSCHWRKKIGQSDDNRPGPIGLCGVLLVIIAFQGYQRETHLVTENREITINETISLWDYAPFKTEGNRLTPLSLPATITIDNDWPRIDGATAAYPVYASTVQALYKGLDESSVAPYISSRRTPEAYKALIAGETDLIFVAQPSEQQKKLAAENGLTLTMIPFAREAFVFIAHKDNPVKNLSVEQIRAIYSGQITNWQAVGGQNINVIPYQRPEGSGSQTTMLAKVMQDTVMRKPLESEMAQGMGGIIRRVANYQNTTNALGYSFRY